MSYLTELAERRPDLFTKEQLDRALKGKRFMEWANGLTKRADEAQAHAEPDGMPKHRKLLTAGRSRAP